MNHPDLEILLTLAREHRASDLLLQENRAPSLRIGGQIVPVEAPPISPEVFDLLWGDCGGKESDTDVDASITDAGGGRYRVNLLRQLGMRAAVLRRISQEIPSMEDLGLPSALLQGWMNRKSGLILVCGPTGSGKSTTVAAMIDWVNRTANRHIVTVEDPVEYLFTPDKCVVTQREIGLDTGSFCEGMRRALRQSPDLIFVGEIRDRATAEIALQASETGHVVISTLHVGRAAEAVTRMRLLFAPDEREFVSQVFSRELSGIFCQRLVQGTAGGVVLAAEHLSNIGVVSQFLAEGKTEELSDFLSGAKTQESKSLTQDLIEKVLEGKITPEVAKLSAPEPMEVTRALRGIR